MLEQLKPYAKAIAAALVGGLVAAGAALRDGTITPDEWITIALGILAPGGATYAIPNKPKAPRLCDLGAGDPPTP